MDGLYGSAVIAPVRSPSASLVLPMPTVYHVSRIPHSLSPLQVCPRKIVYLHRLAHHAHRLRPDLARSAGAFHDDLAQHLRLGVVLGAALSDRIKKLVESLHERALDGNIPDAADAVEAL